MAEIISLSLNKKLLNDLNCLEKEYGFSGRSEAIRAGIRMLLTEQKDHTKLRGTVDAVLMLVHHEKQTQSILQLMHTFQVLVKTNLHHHLEAHECLELFILQGKADNMKQLVKKLRAHKTQVVKLNIL